MDEQLPDVDVIMLHRNLGRAPSFALHQGYHIHPYRAGDLNTWLRIQATGPFFARTRKSSPRRCPATTPTGQSG